MTAFKTGINTIKLNNCCYFTQNWSSDNPKKRTLMFRGLFKRVNACACGEPTNGLLTGGGLSFSESSVFLACWMDKYFFGWMIMLIMLCSLKWTMTQVSGCTKLPTSVCGSVLAGWHPAHGCSSEEAAASFLGFFVFFHRCLLGTRDAFVLQNAKCVYCISLFTQCVPWKIKLAHWHNILGGAQCSCTMQPRPYRAFNHCDRLQPNIQSVELISSMFPHWLSQHNTKFMFLFLASGHFKTSFQMKSCIIILRICPNTTSQELKPERASLALRWIKHVARKLTFSIKPSTIFQNIFNCRFRFQHTKYLLTKNGLKNKNFKLFFLLQCFQIVPSEELWFVILMSQWTWRIVTTPLVWAPPSPRWCHF